MKNLLLLTVLAFLCLNSSFAQCNIFTNPSFTGGTAGSDSIPYWTGCLSGAYQVTMPEPPTITLLSRSGGVYAGLSFGDIGGAITQGSISQALTTTLHNGDTLTIGLVDIPTNNSLHADAAECMIYGGDSICGTLEWLWTSQPIPTGINNTSVWVQDTFIIHPTLPCNYITIMATTGDVTQETGYGFHIGVDSLTINCVKTTTGIDGINTTSIFLYPNPATNMVTVTADGTEPLVFNLYDLTGREIITRECAGTSNTVDVSQLSKGVYLAKILQAGKTHCQKLIIQ